MIEIEAELRGLFGGRPKEVAPKVAKFWRPDPENKKLILPGTDPGQFLIMQVGSVNRFFEWDLAVAYSHEYTMNRWKNSRGPEIAELNTADVIAFPFHTHMLTFVKVGDLGSAANLQIASLREVDRYGNPILGEENEVHPTSAKITALLGLGNRGRAYLTPVDLKGRRALLLTTGARKLNPEELLRLEESILKELE